MPVSPALELAALLKAPLRELDARRISPMLCERDITGGKLLEATGYTFELKLDGVRIVADKRGDEVGLAYRKLRDATDAYPEIAAAVATLDEPRVVLDGEVVAFDAEGNPDFQLLGQRIGASGPHRVRHVAALIPVVFVIFDVLAIGPHDLTGMPIEARRAILERLVPGGSAAGGAIRVPPHFPSGSALFELCRARGLEGVVAKREGSTYQVAVRSPDWVKIKCELDCDLIVVGWAEGEGSRTRLGALDVGAYDERGVLVVRGSVGSGLNDATIDDLLPRLVALEVPTSPAEGERPMKRSRRHVRPEIVIAVRYLALSHEGVLKHPVFCGVRPDVSPQDCVLVFAGPPGTRPRP